jgi:hypothetical protein
MPRRRRKHGPRTRSGRLSRAYLGAARDSGTPEVQARRLALCNGSPPELASTPIGILFANHVITLDQCRAAHRYAFRRGVLFGGARPAGLGDMLEPGSPRLRSDKELAGIRARFEAMCGRLGRDQKAALDVLVVEQRLPAWFRAAKLGRPLRPEDEAEREALLSGLEALVK